MKFVMPIRAAFEPQPDITAFELATLIPYFHGKNMWQVDWDELGTMQRHFRRDTPDATGCPVAPHKS